MGAWPGPTTNTLSPDAAKLSPCEEKLVTCDAIIGAAIEWARQAKQELGVEEIVGNVDTNGGNLNIPATEESELAATMAKPETTLDITLETGGWAVLETGAARFSARNAATKDGKNCWNATATAISLEREFKVPEATAETPTESPYDGGADVEGAGNKSTKRLLNVGRVVGILRKLEATDETSQHKWKWATTYGNSKKASKLPTKNTKRLWENTKELGQTMFKKNRKMEKKNTKRLYKLKTPQPLHTVKLRPHVKSHA